MSRSIFRPIYLVGPSPSGKSRFIFNRDVFYETGALPDEPPMLVATCGLDLRLWTFSCDVNKFSVFDLGGNSRFNAITKGYLSHMPCLCVYFSGLSSDTPDAEKKAYFLQWYKAVAPHAGSKIIYVELPSKEKGGPAVAMQPIDSNLEAICADFHEYKVQADVRTLSGVAFLDAVLGAVASQYYKHLAAPSVDKATCFKPIEPALDSGACTSAAAGAGGAGMFKSIRCRLWGDRLDSSSSLGSVASSVTCRDDLLSCEELEMVKITRKKAELKGCLS
jgi:hypothetical protein